MTRTLNVIAFVVFASAGFYFRFSEFTNGFLEEELFFGEFEVQERSTRDMRQCNAESTTIGKSRFLVAMLLGMTTSWICR